MIISFYEKQVYPVHIHKGDGMSKENKYYIIDRKAVPEVLLKVVEAKRLIEAERVLTVLEATELVGISRSSFYKYKDYIFPFHDSIRDKTITFMMQMDDEPGLLSKVLGEIVKCQVNILTIHQSISVNGIASLTISVGILPNTQDVQVMFDGIEELDGIHYLKILARE